MSSAFRFVTSSKRGQYSVWRGETHIGHVTKIVHRIHDRGVTKTVVAGWTPSTVDGIDLATEKTRDAAANALWNFYHRIAR